AHSWCSKRSDSSSSMVEEILWRSTTLGVEVLATDTSLTYHRELMTIRRCAWAGNDPLMVRYHDREWGVPVHDDRTHFAFLILEGAQAGMSWSAVLRKRAAYRRPVSGFDPEKVARYSAARVRKLLQDPGIIRNRLKIESAVKNASAFLAVQDELGSFDAYCWRFVDGRPMVNRWKAIRQVPA